MCANSQKLVNLHNWRKLLQTVITIMIFFCNMSFNHTRELNFYVFNHHVVIRPLETLTIARARAPAWARARTV